MSENIRIIPLGGFDKIGMNMMLKEKKLMFILLIMLIVFIIFTFIDVEFLHILTSNALVSIPIE